MNPEIEYGRLRRSETRKENLQAMTNIGPNVVGLSLLRAFKVEIHSADLFHTLSLLTDCCDDFLQHQLQRILAETFANSLALTQLYRWRTGDILPRLEEVIDQPAKESSELAVFGSMTIRQAIEVAARTTQEASEFYWVETQRIPDPELEEVYRRLAAQKQVHVSLLHNHCARFPYRDHLPLAI